MASVQTSAAQPESSVSESAASTGVSAHTLRYVTPAQLALAWVNARGGDVVPIPGTKRRRATSKRTSVLNVELTHEDGQRLEHAGSAVPMRL